MQPILRINLTDQSTCEYTIPEEWERNFLGGAPLGARLLFDSLTKALDPLAPEAPLLFITGPLTGTAGPAVGRFVVCGKSPATWGWAESNCGGFWGPELRRCGYDGIWITGKCAKATFLWVEGSKVQFREATRIWGEDTYRSQELIKAEIGNPKARVLTIGPAGEKGVVFAGLFCDHGRTAGRTGLGAVAGAKNLKAIAVRGEKNIPIVEPNLFGQLRKEANLALKWDNVTQVTHDLGTAGVADYADYLGSMPKKYYTVGTLEGIDKISGATMTETILTGTSACHGCVIACGRVVDLGDGTRRKGPEYETVVGFGPNIMNTNLEAIVRLNEICDRQGMDTISASNTIGLAFTLFEKGRITTEDTGMPLQWGDSQAAEKLLYLTASKAGFGRWLALGARGLARHFGVEEEAVQVKGLEVPYHDPRGVSGMALVYATSPRGACHNKSDYFFVDWGQADASLGLEFLDKQAGAEKARNVAKHQNWRSVCDALVMCFFSNISPELVRDLVNSACGYSHNMDDLLRCGERGWTLKRAINTRLGFGREDDNLPKALLTPLKDGPAKGYRIPFNEMLGSYYEARGWDRTDGKPTREALSALGLESITGEF